MRSRGKSALVLAAAVAVMAALVATVLLSSVGSPATAETASVPPWLQERALTLVTEGCQDANPSAVYWKLTTVGEYHVASRQWDPEAEDPGADTDAVSANSARSVYVVVAHGDFTYGWAHIRDGSSLPTGHTLVVVYDLESQVMAELNLLGSDVDAESALGSMNDMTP